MNHRTILVVDDLPEVRLFLEHLLHSWGYRTILAASGEEAWELVQRTPPDLAIVDWEMPGLDGLALCKRIREAPLPNYVYLILLTAREGTASLVLGIEEGADDFIHKPANLAGYSELKARIRAGERILKLEQTLLQKNQREVELNLRLANALETLQKELEYAGNVQRRMLPSDTSATVVHGILFDWLFFASAYLSGDMFNFFPLDATRAGFYCIDVAGHGVAASILSSRLHQLLTPDVQACSPLRRGSIEVSHDDILPPEQVISELNQRFQIDIENCQYFTMIYGVVDSTARTINLCLAGHPHPIFLRRGSPAALIGASGFPVGVIESARWDSFRLHYQKGDRLYISSDGILECCEKDGSMFGVERLLNHIGASQELSLNESLKSLERLIRDWNAGPEFADDVSVLAMEFP